MKHGKYDLNIIRVIAFKISSHNKIKHVGGMTYCA